MHVFVKPILALSLCLACGGAGDDDKTAVPGAGLDSLTTSVGGAGGAADAAAPSPLTEEELQRLLDALEQEIGRK